MIASCFRRTIEFLGVRFIDEDQLVTSSDVSVSQDETVISEQQSTSDEDYDDMPPLED
ncbi:hypothetical protein [Candidatus Similichlamydia epinepheli]|uniref:hypothetical protein n=1 Tax=Candidatus Similichlamydia epinepheli TaxID=1903953 RepID=UPI00130045F4|nr:hypothetical protein [Candidatus Similichlamydia epinepheli]